MATFKIKKAQTLGALSAEDDSLLNEAFVDSVGYLDALRDTKDRGSWFSAHRSRKDGPVEEAERSGGRRHRGSQELSMQHLHNSTLIPKLVDAGVNLDIFYKYLWRHVCVLELIRLRYRDEDDVPTAIRRLFDISMLVSKKKRDEIKKQKEARDAALTYLETYGAEYWIKTDTRIKTITERLQTQDWKRGQSGVGIGRPQGQGIPLGGEQRG